MTTIYKICTATEWADAERGGVYRGSAADVKDGFIHFSTAEQAAETAAKWFAGQRDLVVVAVEADALGDKLKWEPSRGGALFPHLYGELPVVDGRISVLVERRSTIDAATSRTRGHRRTPGQLYV